MISLNRRTISRGLQLSLLGGYLAVSAATPPSDITPSEKRRAAVETAARLAKPKVAASLPEALALPFSPPGFELTDAQERAVNAATTGKTAAPKAASDRDILEEIAAKVPPTGSMFVGGEAYLSFGNRTVKIGAHFTVPLNGQDYDLELVNVDRTNFTLRLNREEITRPIKPAKSP